MINDVFFLAISDNWNYLMRLRDMKYIGFKHQRENKQNSDKCAYLPKLILPSGVKNPPKLLYLGCAMEKIAR